MIPAVADVEDVVAEVVVVEVAEVVVGSVATTILKLLHRKMIVS